MNKVYDKILDLRRSVLFDLMEQGYKVKRFANRNGKGESTVDDTKDCDVSVDIETPKEDFIHPNLFRTVSNPLGVKKGDPKFNQVRLKFAL